MGIPEDRLEKLFDPFEQADNSIARKFGGTGLGLSICLRLAKLMNGGITVESELGLGSTFSAQLGIVPALNQPKQVKTTISGKKVLLHCSKPATQEMLQAQLSDLGVVVSLIEGPDSSVSHAPDSDRKLPDPAQFDLVIVVDVEAATFSRSLQYVDQQLSSLPILQLALTSSSESQSQMLQRGVAGFVCVPCSNPDLAIAIENCLNNGSKRFVRKPITTNVKKLEDVEILRGKKLLLAEDNLVNQRVALALLGRLGAEVQVAGNGLEAIRAVEQATFDLVLMDVQMPEMDGLTATQALRKIYSHQELPIIALTANAMEGDREKCLDAGMTSYCSKPLRPQELLRVVDEVMAN